MDRIQRITASCTVGFSFLIGVLFIGPPVNMKAVILVYGLLCGILIGANLAAESNKS